MNDDNKKRGGAVLFLAVTILPTTATLAQTVPVPQETPRTIPGLVIAAPTPVPTPTDPVKGLPAPDATPRAAEAARPERPRTRTAVVAPRVPSPTPTPTPIDRPTPDATPSMAATPEPAPNSATPSVAPAAVPTEASRAAWPWLAIGAGLVVLLALSAWAVFRRRASAVVEVEPVPLITPPPPVPSAPADPRARIDIALRPLRAGLNMLSAVVEAEVIVTNSGDAPAAQVRIGTTLLSAHAGQDAELAATFAAPPAGRPATPPFALAVDEERRVRVVAALSREAVRSMQAGGRPMFVPLLAIDVRYAADGDGTPGRTGQAFVVGVERVDSAKLAPFWLDAPLRMHDHVAARVQGVVLFE